MHASRTKTICNPKKEICKSKHGCSLQEKMWTFTSRANMHIRSKANVHIKLFYSRANMHIRSKANVHIKLFTSRANVHIHFEKQACQGCPIYGKIRVFYGFLSLVSVYGQKIIYGRIYGFFEIAVFYEKKQFSDESTDFFVLSSATTPPPPRL